jgi:hypothetical protein
MSTASIGTTQMFVTGGRQRSGIRITKVTGSRTVYLGTHGNAATANKGIVLTDNSPVWESTDYNGEVSAVASDASTVIAILEW